MLREVSTASSIVHLGGFEGMDEEEEELWRRDQEEHRKKKKEEGGARKLVKPKPRLMRCDALGTKVRVCMCAERQIGLGGGEGWGQKHGNTFAQA